MNPDGDENQNNLNGVPNADPTQQAIFTPAQTPVPEPPRPAQNSSAIVGSVVEPASTGLSHQYYSNHPTKTSASGIGDIVVRGDKKSKKLPLLIGAIIGGLILIIALIVTFTQNSDKKVLSLLQQNLDVVENVEGVLNGAFYSTLTTESLFSDETRENINQNFPRFEEFAQQFAKINPNKVSANIRESVVKIQEGLNLRSQALAPTLQLYNNLYVVLSGEKTNILREYADSENENLQFLAKRFSNVGADSFWRSTTIPQVVLSTYDANLYYYKQIMPEIENLINGSRK